MQNAPHRSREPALVVRERAIIEGTAPLSDQELLSVVLDPSGRSRAAWDSSARLLALCGGLPKLSRFRALGLSELCQLSERDALRLLAAVELGRRAERHQRPDLAGQPLTAEAVFSWARPRLGHLEHEEIWVLCLDSRTRLRSTWLVGRGGLHGCAVLPRDVLVPVVREAAAAFVLVHNHPSGDPTPSREDVAFTRALSQAGTTLSIPLLDHVVVASDGYRSLLDLGQL